MALAEQQNAPTMEVIVPHHLEVDGIDELRRRFPEVRFIAIEDLRLFHGLGGGSREHHDELRARGLAAARGEIIGLLEDHARPDAHWAERVSSGHQQGFAAVGGAIENGVDRPLNWAVYFCDFGLYQNPVAAGASPFVSDANVTYKRSALETVRSSWEAVFHETTVNWALTSRGEKLALSPEVIVFQHRDGLDIGSALKERYVWGRSYAATRSQLLDRPRRLVHAALAPALPAILLYRMAGNVFRKGRNVGRFAKALPLTALLTVSWSLGEFLGYLTARTSRDRGV
jgi:hypothetical protein